MVPFQSTPSSMPPLVKSLLREARGKLSAAYGEGRRVSGTGRPQHKMGTPTFVARPDTRCEDCEVAGRLDAVGLPRLLEITPLRPTKLKRGATTSFGCETCGGTGRVSAPKGRRGCSSNDPMEIPEKG